MGWIAWAAAGTPGVAHPSLTQCAQIETGALTFETQIPQSQNAETLLEVQAQHPEHSLLRIQAIPGEGFSILLTYGPHVFHALICHTLTARTARVRLTFNWTASGKGALTIEHPGDDNLFFKSIDGCPPMPGALIVGALSQLHLQPKSRTEDFIAFHQGALAVGPEPTLEYHTPILTPNGYQKIGTLQAGDLVISADGDIVPILGTLHSVVPPVGTFRPIRLRAPYFGLQSDLIVAATQRIIVGGSVVEYMFGRDSVQIPAEHLVNGTAAIHQPTQGLMRYHQVLLPHGQAITASGVQVESAFIGRIRRRKDLFPYTTLAHVPRHLLPEHAKPTRPVLKPFEAITLAEMRAA